MKVNKTMILAVLAFLILNISVLSAMPVDKNTCSDIYVGGTVYSQGIDSPVVGNVDVVVHCEGNTENTLADDNGEYITYFNSGECGIGDNIYSCVKNTCSDKIVIQDCDLNTLYIMGVDIFNVPEFGVIAAGVAMIGGLCGYFFLRKK